MGSNISHTISIIIPARNEERYIEKTLNSIKEQTYTNYEIIVVANGCTDNTTKIAKKYTKKIINIQETGVSKSRNLGAKKAKGELLLFLDADVKLSKRVLEKINKNFKPQYSVATLKGKPDTTIWWHKLIVEAKNFLHKTKLYPSSSGTIIVRKKKFKGFKEELHVKETSEFIQRHGKFLYINEPVTISMRRYKKWGLLKVTSFWIIKDLQHTIGTSKNKKYEIIR